MVQLNIVWFLLLVVDLCYILLNCLLQAIKDKIVIATSFLAVHSHHIYGMGAEMEKPLNINCSA